MQSLEVAAILIVLGTTLLALLLLKRVRHDHDYKTLALSFGVLLSALGASILRQVLT